MSDGRAVAPVTSLMHNDEFSYWAPVWSPDGKSVMARRSRGAAPKDLFDRKKNQPAAEQLVLYLTNGGKEQTLPGPVSPQPHRWFHDNEKILAFASNRDCNMGCVLGRNIRTGESGFVVATTDFRITTNLMALSADDKTLYLAPRFPAPGDTKNNKLVVVDLPTGVERQRLTLPTADNIQEMALSPDGRTLAIWTDPDPKTGESRLFRVGIDGSGYREIYRGQGHCLAWTPDGSSIFFAKSERADEWQIMRIPAGGGKEQFTGVRVQGVQYISLSPDGKRLAFDGAAPTVN
jgi:Tol biopolymer transport system component